MKTEELSYWAGVFEFAGSIRFRRTKKGRTPVICLGSKNLPALDQLMKIFGGGIRWTGSYARWEITGSNALKVIQLLSPHMKIRKVSADLLNWLPGKRGVVPAGARRVRF